MKVAIMQPYIFPYIGYFQLIQSVDSFVVYDNIQYTKKGWINRNRILSNGTDEYISFPLKHDSDFLNINQRYLSDTWQQDRKKILSKLEACYSKAPYFETTFALLERCIQFEDSNLFNFIYHSLGRICDFVEIKTPMVVSSSIDIDHSFKSEEKVMAICHKMSAGEYLNPIGGLELYNKEKFAAQGIQLSFIKTNPIVYPQLENEFVPSLSIIDVLMFNSKERVREFISNEYQLVKPINELK